MAILKIKNENGEFINIASIVGPKGEPGETPDLSNYATKEEVDEKIGDINTILATLTEVSE